MPTLPVQSDPLTAHPHTRMSGEDRRRQLIEVAIDLFSRRGFAGTTTKEIAVAAGVTEAIIFRHFATKQDLYKAILDYKCQGKGAHEWLAGIQKLMDANDDEGLFRLVVSVMIAAHRDEPQFQRLLLYAALEGHELAIMHHNQMKLPIGEKFKEYIVRRQQQGALRHCDPALVLHALAGIPQFYAMQKYVHKCCELPLTDEQVVDAFMLILMNGLRNTEQKGNPK